MDMVIWRALTAAVRSADQRVPRRGRRPRYSDALVTRMYLWSVWHDRPLCWACNRAHYNRMFRPRQLPSVSQFSRRVQGSLCGPVGQDDTLGNHETLVNVR